MRVSPGSYHHQGCDSLDNSTWMRYAGYQANILSNRQSGLGFTERAKDVHRTTSTMTSGDYITQHRHNLAKTTNLRIILEECRGDEKGS